MNEISTPKAATLADLEAMLGEEHKFEGIDEVSRNDIRRKLEVYCFACPLYYDKKVAQAHGYKDVTAPGVMTPLWAMPSYWSPGEDNFYIPNVREKSGGIRIDLPPVYPRGVNTATDWEFFEPVYPGDNLHGNWRVSELKPRTTRLGEGVFVTTETSIFKQSNELVAKNRNTLYRYKQTGEEGSGKREKKEESDKLPTEGLPPATVSHTPVDWSKQLRFSDVKVGDFVPPMSLWLSYQRIVMSVSVDRMFSGIHHNRDYAKQAGFNDIIFNTRSYEFLFEVMLRRWVGLDGRVTKVGPFRMTGSSYPDDTVTSYARVTDTVDNGKDKRVKLQIWVANDRGEAGRGDAEVSLPA